VFHGFIEAQGVPLEPPPAGFMALPRLSGGKKNKEVWYNKGTKCSTLLRMIAISIRLTDEEKKYLEKFVQGKKMTVSGWSRGVLLGAAGWEGRVEVGDGRGKGGIRALRRARKVAGGRRGAGGGGGEEKAAGPVVKLGWLAGALK